MALEFIVKVTARPTGMVFYAERGTGAGTPDVNNAQRFPLFSQAIEVRNQIKALVGDKAHVEVDVAPKAGKWAEVLV